MKIKNKDLLHQLMKDLHRIQEYSNDTIEIEDNEIHTKIDIYDRIQGIIETITEDIIKKTY